MALTTLQRTICRLIARHRMSSGESYVAGGAALNELAFADRLSHDIDLFHDTEAALEATWLADRDLLTTAGFSVRVLRERPGLVEAEVADAADPAVLSRRWHVMLAEAQRVVSMLPAEAAGSAVLTRSGELCRAGVDELNVLVQDHAIQFHPGRIRGALPTVQQ